MGSTTKSVVTTVIITLFSGLSYKALSHIFDEATNQNYLESLNYKTLFETKRDQFSKWKGKYLLHQKEINKLIPEFKGVESNIQGAYLLKKWCEARLNEYFSPDQFDSFNMIKNYCTMDLKSAMTEKESVKSIDEGNSAEKNKTFEKLKDKLVAKGIEIKVPGDKDNVKLLVRWCRENLRMPYIPENYSKLDEMEEYCKIAD